MLSRRCVEYALIKKTERKDMYVTCVCVCTYRPNKRSAIKHSQSGDVSQAAYRPKGRRKLQRGQSEDVPYPTRPQVLLLLRLPLLQLLSLSISCCCIRPPLLALCFQEAVERKRVENVSDNEAYPSLEGQGRAASLPRLNAEYYVSPSLSLLTISAGHPACFVHSTLMFFHTVCVALWRSFKSRKTKFYFYQWVSLFW